MKTCSRCGQTKPLAAFLFERRRQRHTARCSKCNVEKAREYRQKNPDFEKRRYQRVKSETRERHLIKKYGVSLADYARMLERQQGLCAICGVREETQHKGVFHIDHCHKTGIVRGLLCRGCNHMLGVVRDDPAILDRAISYLAAHSASSHK